MNLDIAPFREWIGRSARAEDVVTGRLAECFVATFAPHLAPVAQGEAPLALHWCLAPPVAPLAELGPDGHGAKGDFLPPVPLPRRMWAGGEVETGAALRVGDRVVRRSTIAGIDLKQGRTGPLCFVAVRHEIANDRGLAVRERHDIVYRDAAAAEEKSPAGPPPMAEEAPPRRQADLVWRIDASPVLLFRYSALTFNGHRIHYDHPYVTEVETYPGLVVHGPLQATLLFNLAATLGGRAPARFRYRALSPLIAGGVFEACGARRPGDGGIACWTRDARGRICMEGEGAWP